MNAQYITQDGEVDRDIMIADLKELERGSSEQTHLINEMLKELRDARRIHSELKESDDKRGRVGLTIIHLGNQQGDFFFLNPQYDARRAREREKANDTMSLEVLIW